MTSLLCPNIETFAEDLRRIQAEVKLSKADSAAVEKYLLGGLDHYPHIVNAAVAVWQRHQAYLLPA